MNLFNAQDYAKLATLFDPRAGFAGYRPNVREIPNGDGKIDLEKRFLHVAPKYNPPAWALAYLARAHYEACRIAEALGVPAAFYPRVADGTLRVLEYPAGVGGEQHTDFDLFTVALYRSSPGDLVFDDACDDAEQAHAYRERLLAVNQGLHMGEIGELVGLGPATPHRVTPAPYVQHSIVYFAMPDHAALLPGAHDWQFKATAGDCVCQKCGKLAARPDAARCSHGQTVAEWLKQRIDRSRKAV